MWPGLNFKFPRKNKFPEKMEIKRKEKHAKREAAQRCFLNCVSEHDVRNLKWHYTTDLLTGASAANSNHSIGTMAAVQLKTISDSSD